MTQLARGDIREEKVVDVRIDDYGFRGEGYVRLDDGWLSVSGAIPGELVRVRLQPGQREGARRLFADVVEVLEAAPERRDPLCERDQICRGCQLRHLTVDTELRFKVRTIREVIERYAGLPEAEQPEIDVVTPQPIARGDAFRIRSRLSYRRRGDEFSLGLHTPVREQLISMERCPALTKPLQRLVKVISSSLEQCDRLPDAAEDDGATTGPGVAGVRVVSPTHGVGLVEVELAGTDDEEQFLGAVEEERLEPWLTRLAATVPEQVGLAVSSGEFRHIVKEPSRIRVPIGKWEMEIGYDDWFHATLRPAEQVYSKMMDWLDIRSDERLVDIGCGTGTITLMTAERATEVVGIDINSSSIEAAEINAVGHGRENVEFVVGGWEKALRQLAMREERFSVATINPMREPLGYRPLAFLERLGVERLVYLGPSPEAAAKDIGELRQMGWSVERLAAGNLHPATYHTLLMALVVRD